jgi:hypothetical protein
VIPADGAVRFTASLAQAEGKRATGIEVPLAVLDQLGGGKRPAVRATLNGWELRTTIGAMGGRAMISVSAAVRDATGLAAGDAVDVELVIDDAPRQAVIPDDLAAAFAANPGTGEFFAGLSPSLQRYHVDSIGSAKAPETRARRVEKAIALFLAGTPR